MSVSADWSTSSAPLVGRTVYLFPGQGSQVKRMREPADAACPDLVALAQELLGEDPFAGAKRSTRLLQPAIYCASMAAWRLARDVYGFADAAFAGHSLGEIAALVAAGAMSPEDGLRLVVLRGTLMEQAATASPRGGMMAVLGADGDWVAELGRLNCLTVAGDNAPGELILTGDGDNLERLAAELIERDLKTVRLAIKGAFHSPQMQTAWEPLHAAAERVAPRAPRHPVYSSVTADLFDDIPRRLADSLTHPVRWRETLLALRLAGARSFVELGPGNVLTRLVERTLPGAEAETFDAAAAVRQPA